MSNLHKNIVLIGMPGCGKSTIGKILSKELSMRLVDTDKEIVKKEKRPITDIFSVEGEKYFRDVEEEIVTRFAKRNNIIISVGGGAILRENSVKALKKYGRLYFLDRDVESLIPTSDRPLANNADKIRNIFKERYPIYKACADVIVDGNKGIESEIVQIKRDRDEYKSN